MLKLPNQVQIKEVLTDSFRDATIVKLVRQEAQREIDGRWWWGADWIADPDNEEDRHWEWGRLVREVRRDPLAECAAVQLADGSIQGAMRYRLDGRSRIETDEPAVYVEFLATAPGNRPWLVAQPRFRGTGDALLFHAVCHSWQFGFGGRVVLEAIPDSRTLEFYENRAFRRLQELEDGTIACELEPAAARQWLTSNGVLT